MMVTLRCGCVIEAEYGDCTCCGCPRSNRDADGACYSHDLPEVTR